MRFPFCWNRDSVKNGILISIRWTGDGFHPGLFSSNLVQSGMDVSVVRMIMGHEHLSTTQKYTHLSNPYIEDSLSRYWNQSTLIGGDSDGK